MSRLFANFLANLLKKKGEGEMEHNKISVIIKIANADEFRSLVEKFSKKAHELNEIAHELESFHFEGEIESQAMSSNADKAE